MTDQPLEAEDCQNVLGRNPRGLWKFLSHNHYILGKITVKIFLAQQAKRTKPLSRLTVL